MFPFATPTGLSTFHMSQEMANTCAILAKNQGLYNGFLAAALLLAVLTRSALMRRYGLGCVVVAGFYGGWSLGSKDTALVPGATDGYRAGAERARGPHTRQRRIAQRPPAHDDALCAGADSRTSRAA